MTKRSMAPLIFLFVLILSSCGPVATPMPTPTPIQTPMPTQSAADEPPLELTPDQVSQTIATLSLEEKVGQLFVAGFEGTTAGDDISASIQSFHVGGVILYRRNVESATQLTRLISELRVLNGDQIPLFLSTDQEGGLVERMPPELRTLPTAYEVAQAGGLPAVQAMAQAIAAQCTAFGLNLNYAPSLDVWSNPQNTVIGKRAFGDRFETVAELGPAAASAMLEGGVIPVVKHFPGHGDTAVDSHVGLPHVEQTPEELHAGALAPFRRAIQGAPTPVPAIMVAHILMTGLDSQRPATLSHPVVTRLLRQEMGFEGVIFTDDLTMGAITQNYDLGEACILALEAGCDVLLVCHVQSNVETAYATVLEAARSGRLTEARIDESLRRILTLKYAVGLTNDPLPSPDLAAVNALTDQVWAYIAG